MNDSIMELGGYRNMILEERIQMCLDEVSRGETSVCLKSDDLTESEVEYVMREVQRRSGG